MLIQPVASTETAKSWTACQLATTVMSFPFMIITYQWGIHLFIGTINLTSVYDVSSDSSRICVNEIIGDFSLDLCLKTWHCWLIWILFIALIVHINYTP